MKKRPRGTNQLGKVIVDIATGEVDDDKPKSAKSRGGLNRVKALSPSAEGFHISASRIAVVFGGRPSIRVPRRRSREVVQTCWGPGL